MTRRNVGRGRRSTGTQFRKGQSGNPNGRPKKPKQPPASAFEGLLDLTFQVKHGGELRSLTVEERLQVRTYQDAVAGKAPAIRQVLRMIDKREKEIAKDRFWVPIQRFVEREPISANEALLLLGIAERGTRLDYPSGDVCECLFLQRWATQRGLSRPGRRRRLSVHDVAEIKSCTRDADQLRWPASVQEDDDE